MGVTFKINCNIKFYGLQTSHPAIEKFQELLDQNPHVFYPSRTAKALMTHWQLLKQYQLLPDQTVQPLPKSELFLIVLPYCHVN